MFEGRVVVSDGFNNDGHLNTVDKYIDIWSYMPNMIVGGCDNQLVAIKNILFVMSGTLYLQKVCNY